MRLSLGHCGDEKRRSYKFVSSLSQSTDPGTKVPPCSSGSQVNSFQSSYVVRHILSEVQVQRKAQFEFKRRKFCLPSLYISKPRWNLTT